MHRRQLCFLRLLIARLGGEIRAAILHLVLKIILITVYLLAPSTNPPTVFILIILKYTTFQPLPAHMPF